MASVNAAIALLALPMLAASTFLVTITSEFWRGVMAFSIQFMLFLTVQVFVISKMFTQSVASPLTVAVIYGVIVLCLSVALLLHWQCHRRLARMEWGLASR